MFTNFLNRFDFSEPRFTSEVFLFLIIIWCVIVSCAIWSICAKIRSLPAKALWILVVIFLPIIGLLLYLPFSMDNDALQSFVRFGRRG